MMLNDWICRAYLGMAVAIPTFLGVAWLLH